MAFACYRLPNAKRSDHIIGTASHRLRDDERAFAFAPFDTEKKPYYITAQSPGHKNPAGFFLEKSKQKSTTKNQFTQAVKEIISRIAGGDFKKVVAARVLAINKPSSFDPVVFFKKLCDYYPSAFVSMTLVPGVGLWIGASPEILVSETESSITSYSLAGTKAVDDPKNGAGKKKKSSRSSVILSIKNCIKL
jgi:isochorismate synthase EntC